LCGVADCNPADRHHDSSRDDRVHLDHPVDPHLGAAPDSRSGKQRCAGRDEGLVIHRCAVDVRVRSDHDRVADPHVVSGPTANKRVLHHDGVLADVDRAVLRRDHSTVQNAGTGCDGDVSADDGSGSDPGIVVDGRCESAMFDQHAATLGRSPLIGLA